MQKQEYELVSTYQTEAKTSIELENIEGKNYETEEVADIARLYKELKKFSTLTKTLQLSLQNWKLFPSTPSSSDNCFKKLSSMLVPFLFALLSCWDVFSDSSLRKVTVKLQNSKEK